MGVQYLTAIARELCDENRKQIKEGEWTQIPVNKKELWSIKKKIKKLLELCKPKANIMYGLHELTCDNMEEVLCYTEIPGAKFLLSLGFQLYYITSKEDAQWCDIICWSKAKKQWFIVELKYNTEEPLFNEYGRFIRLGATTNYYSLRKYFERGVRLNNIAKQLGIAKILLIYYGRLRADTEEAFYNITYGEWGIKNVMKIERDFNRFLD